MAIIVNGEVATKDRLLQTLQLYRDDALRNLAIEMAVDQAARRKKITLTAQEATPAWAEQLDPDLRLARLQQHRGELLFRRLILSDATEADRKELYEAFKDQLALYTVRQVRVVDALDYARFQEEMTRKTSMAVLEQRYGLAGQPAVERQINLEGIRELVGVKDYRKVLEAPIGSPVGPLPSLGGPILVQIKEIKNDFASLKPQIDEIIFASRTQLYSHQLGADSFVNSPLSSPNVRSRPTASASPSSTPSSPKLLPTPAAPKELPKPGSLPTVSGPGELPAPNKTPVGPNPFNDPVRKQPAVPGANELPDLKATPGQSPKLFVPTATPTP